MPTKTKPWPVVPLGEELVHYTIYENPSDYPGKYVVRRMWPQRGVLVMEEDCRVEDTLEAARAHVPAGSVLIGPSPGDDPVIKEVWL